jgi:type I site-specific restriction endonuclease
MSTEANTCRTLVLPKLYAAGWTDDQLAEQRSYRAGRIVPKGQGGFRKKPKRTDYLLRYTRDLILAVVEAKQEFKHAADGIQQAKDYAKDLGLKFAYATNGHSIVEFDFLTGQETELRGFPCPTDLWSRIRADSEDSAQSEPPKFYNVGCQNRPQFAPANVINEGNQFVATLGTQIAAHIIQELDPDAHQLYCASITDYTGRQVRSIAKDSEDLRQRWIGADQRADIVKKLAERGIDFQTLALEAGKPDADPFDLLCHLGFNTPMMSRRQRANRLLKDRAEYFGKFGPDARAILGALLEKYAAGGEVQFVLPAVLKVPPISNRGNVPEIIQKFGGAEGLRNAVIELQMHLYAA